MRAIDTNVLVRLIARDHPAQLRSALQAVKGGAWVSHLALAEAVWVLRSSFALGRREIAATLDTLLTHGQLEFEDKEVAAAAAESFKTSAKAEFTDCLLLEIARKAGHRPMLTFDRDFARLEGVERIGAKD